MPVSRIAAGPNAADLNAADTEAIFAAEARRHGEYVMCAIGAHPFLRVSVALRRILRGEPSG